MIDLAEGPGRDLKNIRQIGTTAEGDRIYIENVRVLSGIQWVNTIHTETAQSMEHS